MNRYIFLVGIALAVPQSKTPPSATLRSNPYELKSWPNSKSPQPIDWNREPCTSANPYWVVGSNVCKIPPAPFTKEQEDRIRQMIEEYILKEHL